MQPELQQNLFLLDALLLLKARVQAHEIISKRNMFELKVLMIHLMMNTKMRVL